MTRLSLGAMALLVLAMPATTWSLVPKTEVTQYTEGEDESVLWSTGSREASPRADDNEGRGSPRQLHADPDPTLNWIINGRSNLRGADTQGEEVVPNRSYLNSLVDSSAANTDNQVANIAFVKTHKTGSTSMAAILYRYAARHDLKLAKFGRYTSVDLRSLARKVKRGSVSRVDIMHYHLSPQGHYHGKWSDAEKNYRGIMRDPDNVNFITVMREPRSHFLSYYYYYFQPVNQLSLEEYLENQPSTNDRFRLLYNPLSSEFGATSLAEVEQLIAQGLSSFKLIFLTERFDEGLMVLRRLLGWDMIDMTYVTLNETKQGAQRWDGKPFVDKPSFEDLPEKVQNKIDELTALDRLLYAAAEEEYAKRLQPVADVIEADLREFEGLQNVVSDFLNANISSKANAMYRAEDVYSGAPPSSPF